MLTDPMNLPAVSTTPLPSDWGQQQAQDVYDLYAAGLTAKFASDCVPPPSTFDFGPATSYTVVPNLASPALSTASSGRVAINPLVQAVQGAQSTLGSMLVNRNPALANVVNSAGGQGAVFQPSDFSDAAEVLPMGPTQSTSVNPAVLGGANGGQSVNLGVVGGANGSTGNGRLTLARRKRAQNNGAQPQPPWGGIAERLPGGCQSVQHNPWGKLLLLVGLGIVVLAVAND